MWEKKSNPRNCGHWQMITKDSGKIWSLPGLYQSGVFGVFPVEASTWRVSQTQNITKNTQMTRSCCIPADHMWRNLILDVIIVLYKTVGINHVLCDHKIHYNTTLQTPVIKHSWWETLGFHKQKHNLCFVRRTLRDSAHLCGLTAGYLADPL